MEDKVFAKQKKQIDIFSGQLENAYGKVQDIAVKAVSGSQITISHHLIIDLPIKNRINLKWEFQFIISDEDKSTVALQKINYLSVVVW